MLNGKEQLKTAVNELARAAAPVGMKGAVGSRVGAIRRMLRDGTSAGLLIAGLLNGCTLDTKGQGVDNLHNDAGIQDVNPDNTVWPETGGNAGSETGGSAGTGGVGGSAGEDAGDAGDAGGSAGTGGVGGSAGEDAGDAGGSAGTGGVAGAGGEDAGDAGGSAGTGGVAGAGGEDAGDAGEAGPDGSVCGPTEKSISYSDEMNCFKVLYVRSSNIMGVPPSSNNDHNCQSNPFSDQDVLPGDIAFVWVGEPGNADASAGTGELKFNTCNVTPAYVTGTCVSNCNSVPDWNDMAVVYNNTAQFLNLVPTQTSPWAYNVNQSCACKAYKIHL